MSNKNLSKVQFYTIQNGSYLTPEGQVLRSKIYDLWYPQWTEIYKSWGSTNVPSIRDFRSFEVIHCITVDGEVAGMSAHRFMDIQDDLNKHLEYFQSFGDENILKLQEMGVHKIMTFESLLVPPTQRKSQTPLPVSKLLFYLANKTFSFSLADGMVGTARIDVKVPQLSFALGYEVVEASRKVRIIPCDIVVQRNREIFHPHDEAWKQASELWENRVVVHNEDPFALTRPEKAKKAA